MGRAKEQKVQPVYYGDIMEDPKDFKIVYMPGCFDNLDITQEELDELMKSLEEQVRSGELFKNSQRISVENLEDEFGLDIEDILGTRALDDYADERKKKLN